MGQVRRFGVKFKGAELSPAKSKGFGMPSCGTAGVSLRPDFALLCLGEGVLVYSGVGKEI